MKRAYKKLLRPLRTALGIQVAEVHDAIQRRIFIMGSWVLVRKGKRQVKNPEVGFVPNSGGWLENDGAATTLSY
jgi:hypothetical protein